MVIGVALATRLVHRPTVEAVVWGGAVLVGGRNLRLVFKLLAKVFQVLFVHFQVFEVLQIIILDVLSVYEVLVLDLLH